MTSVRYRGKKNLLELTKNLDAFAKLPEEYQETSEVGGTISVISRILIIYLIYNEIQYYSKPNSIFTFQPDIDLDVKIRMNVDITIAMPCIGLSGPVDLVDDTKQNLFSYGILKRESTWWELDSTQRLYFDEMQHVNKFLREEYHSLADILFKDILSKEQEHKTSLHHDLPSRTNKPDKPYDACRLHGTFLINKVAGILYMIGGERISFGFSNNQWHFNEFNRVQTNFSHRINKLSFGDLANRIIQPLEGDEKIIPVEKAVIQYFIDVVPTQIHNVFSTIDTYQYSVKENVRVVDSHKNSYGLPGIYFQYDWAPLKVIVKPDRESIINFTIRLCSVIAGIVKLSGIVKNLIQFLHGYLLKFIAPYYFKKNGSLITSQLPIANKNLNTKSKLSLQSTKIAATNNSKNYSNVTNSLLSKANLIPNETLPIFVNK